VAFFSEERTELRLRYLESGFREDLHDVVVLELEGHTELLEDDVVVGELGWGRGTGLVFATLEVDQAIQEFGHDLLAARLEARLVIRLEVGVHHGLGHFTASELYDVDQLELADVEDVADTADDVVVDHAGPAPQKSAVGCSF